MTRAAARASSALPSSYLGVTPKLAPTSPRPSLESRIVEEATRAVYRGTPRQQAEGLVPNVLWEASRRALEEIANLRDFGRFRQEKLDRVAHLYKKDSGLWGYRYSNKHRGVFRWDAKGGPDGTGIARDLRLVDFTKRL